MAEKIAEYTTVSKSYRKRHTVKTMALIIMDTFPTLKSGYRIVQYIPMISVPPPELPFLKINPPPRPEIKPAMIQEVRGSSTNGLAGMGISERNADCTEMQIRLFKKKDFPIFFQANIISGILMIYRKIPVKSKDGFQDA